MGLLLPPPERNGHVELIQSGKNKGAAGIADRTVGEMCR